MSIGGPVAPDTGLPPPDPSMAPEDQAILSMPPKDPNQKIVPRAPPEPSEQRKRLVTEWTSKVKSSKKHWEPNFRQMIRDQRFCSGQQWTEETKASAFNDELEDRYVANITLRHVKQRVAALYAKNPKAVAKPRRKMYSTVWDGTIETYKQAQTVLQQAQAQQDLLSKLLLGAGIGMAASNAGIPLGTLTGQPEYAWQVPPKGLPPNAPGLSSNGGAGPPTPGPPTPGPPPTPDAGGPGGPPGGPPPPGPPGMGPPGPPGLPNISGIMGALQPPP